MKLLIVEDQPKTGHYLRQGLAEAGFNTELVADGTSGQHLALTGDYDLLILDVMLPGRDGWQILQAVRNAGLDMPVLFLTARDAVEDRVHGLELGADDYLPKPFEPRELVARLQTVLRRRVAAPPPLPAARPDTAGRLLFDGLLIDPATRSVQRLGQPVALTSTEFDLLHLLARDAGRVFHRDDILNQLRGHEADLYSRAVDILISRLRKKLEPLEAIKTLRHAGYALALARQPA